MYSLSPFRSRGRVHIRVAAAGGDDVDDADSAEPDGLQQPQQDARLHHAPRQQP